MDIVFEAGAASEKMRITSGGNVGIANTSPSKYLHIGPGTDTPVNSNQGLYISNNGTTALVIRDSTNNSEFTIQTQSGSAILGTLTNSDLIFYTNNADRMRIASTGAVTIVGSLSKGSGSFRIDHPLKPDTHQLVHSFIEGPQADLIYRGKLTLVNGKSQANIDEVSTMTEGTFEALCREVQCFTTNENGWDLVKGKVIGNIIYIESQNPNSTDEISWMVIGERKDKHMMDTEWTDEQGKVIVEPLKENKQK